MRNVELTKARLIEAAGEILATEGFHKFGINAVARRAKVNKALIYRYFGDMDGLIKAYACQSDFWPPIEELLAKTQSGTFTVQQIRQILLNYWQALEDRPQTLSVMAWEMVERNQLTAILETHREKSSALLAQHLMQQLGSENSAAQQKLGSIMAMASASVHYLLLRKRNIRWYAGIDLHNQQEIERILTETAQMVFNSLSSD